MDNRIFLYLATILSGFALIRVPLAGSFLEGVTPVTNILGILTVLVFSLVLIYKGVKSLFQK
jgi:amino acid transporter